MPDEAEVREYAVMVPMWDDMYDPDIDFNDMALSHWEVEVKHAGYKPYSTPVVKKLERATIIDGLGRIIPIPKGFPDEPDYYLRVQGRVILRD